MSKQNFIYGKFGTYMSKKEIPTAKISNVSRPKKGSQPPFPPPPPYKKVRYLPFLWSL